MNNITLKQGQQRVFDQLIHFINHMTERFFILKGYAGTGKTTLIRFLTEYLQKHNRAFQMLAPTGRAAKVMDDIVVANRFDDNNLIRHATTIHSMIYTYSGFNRDVTEEELEKQNSNGQLNLVFSATKCDINDHNTVVYIVDEASMISNKADPIGAQATFGSGQLLHELTQYDQRPGSKFIFIGDPCQLPPVNDCQSPALMPETFSPPAQWAQLTEIIRQADGSDIITISKNIRNQIGQLPNDKRAYGNRKLWGTLPFGHSSSFVLHASTGQMVNHYVDNMRSNGYTDSIFICNYNKTANAISLEARRQLLKTNSTLPIKKDLLLVIQNNYPTGLVNGDMVEVVQCNNNIHQCAGLSFVEVMVREIGSRTECRTLLLLDTLNSMQLNLSTTQQTALFLNFIGRMKKIGIKQKSQAFNEKLQHDPYLNALRCTFGYAVTCHKAQGGEWQNTYLQLPRNITLNPTKQDYQWLYTAITRAKEKIHITQDFFIR